MICLNCGGTQLAPARVGTPRGTCNCPRQSKHKGLKPFAFAVLNHDEKSIGDAIIYGGVVYAKDAAEAELKVQSWAIDSLDIASEYFDDEVGTCSVDVREITEVL